MFTKLLAYEIRSHAVADGRSFGAFIVTIAVASGIVAAGLPGISGSTAVLAYALCALTPVACAIAALADYWKTLYGQRGYFTMSLPISGKVIFWAKNTRIMIECLLALVLAVGGILAVASAAAWSDGISLAEMSKGMGEKLQISLIMSRRARVYLLDEPISGVDPATRDVILEGILREFDPASLLIMSTHLISDIEHFVDYALFMKDGQVLLQGDADDLRATHGDSLDAIFRKEYR